MSSSLILWKQMELRQWNKREMEKRVEHRGVTDIGLVAVTRIQGTSIQKLVWKDEHVLTREEEYKWWIAVSSIWKGTFLPSIQNAHKSCLFLCCNMILKDGSFRKCVWPCCPFEIIRPQMDVSFPVGSWNLWVNSDEEALDLTVGRKFYINMPVHINQWRW